MKQVTPRNTQPIITTIIAAAFIINILGLVIFSKNKFLKSDQKLATLPESNFSNTSPSTQSQPTTDSDSATENNYTLKVVQNKFLIFSNHKLLKEIAYKPETSKTLLLTDNHPIVADNCLFFIVYALPTGCEGNATQECFYFLDQIAAESRRYAGVWKFNLSNSQLTHLIKSPQENQVFTEIVDFGLDSNNSLIWAEFSFTQSDGSEKLVTQRMKI